MIKNNTGTKPLTETTPITMLIVKCHPPDKRVVTIPHASGEMARLLPRLHTWPLLQPKLTRSTCLLLVYNCLNGKGKMDDIISPFCFICIIKNVDIEHMTDIIMTTSLLLFGRFVWRYYS